MKMVEKHGTEVFFLRGNHDDFLDKIIPMSMGKLNILKDMILESGSDKYFVTHGDVFDSITSNMKWKGFTLGATFDYRGGHVTRFGIEYNALFTGSSYLSGTSGRQRFVFPNSVIEVTDANGNVSYQENSNITVYTGGVNFWNGVYKQGRANQVISAASWRLRELSLGYEVPQKYLKKVGFLQRASISLVGRNLFMWTPKTNIFGDPDYTGSGGNSNISGSSYNRNVSGMAGTSSTSTRNYGFNLLLSF